FWDDSLTEEEIDILCGVYRLQTGNGNQESYVSWWPRPSAWRGSGLNVGYWSPACESWFKRRLEQIQNGTAEMRSAKRWKSSLVLLRKQAKIAQTNELLASDWIKSKLNQ
ncbi:hypothetical protein M422DRAFT_160667, partial [Sphaerobolus stellatus SS14]